MGGKQTSGQRGEEAAAQAVVRLGYTIVARNWRTRWCEIDIVATKNNVVYFIEVKYRSSDRQGDGLAYITPKKLRQMHFAAEMWCANNQWTGDYELAAIAVTGPYFEPDRLVLIS